MSSWTATGEPFRRIADALSKWHCTGYVEWKDRCAEWVRSELDATRYSTKIVASLMHKHVAAGGRVRAQRDTSGEFDDDIWYSIVVRIDGKDRFIKFVLDPDIEDEPGLTIKSIHDQVS